MNLGGFSVVISEIKATASRSINGFLLVVFISSHSWCAAQQDSSKLASTIGIHSTCTSCTALVEIGDSIAFNNWLTKHSNILITKTKGQLWQLTGASNLKQQLLNAPGVKYIDRGNRHAQPETVLGDFDITANSVMAAKASYPLIQGENLTLSIKEKPFDKTDIDLRGRVKVNKYFDEAETLHATIMATIAAGAGNSSSHAEGVARASTVTTSDYDNLLPDPGIELLNDNVTVQNHSYGVGVENYYGIESREYDQAAIDFPKVLHVFSSGNSGDQAALDGQYAGLPAVANITGQFKTAKNVLTVGSVDRIGNLAPQSSRGPAYDGRIKPEVVAYGDAGSSESAAIVSGSVLLIQDAHRQLTGNLPDAALIRCILINSADDVGKPGIDYECGFGNVNIKKAIATIQNTTFSEGSIQSNEMQVFEIDIPDGALNFKATLSWDDPAATPFNEHALIHDLDLEVETPSGLLVKPWILNPGPTLSEIQADADRGTDTLNNNEQVSFNNAGPGIYRLIVKSKNLATSSQKYFITFDLGREFEWHHPVDGSFLIPNDINVLRWSSDLTSNGSLQYRRFETEPWISIGEVDLSNRLFEWQAPEETGNVQFRMLVGNNEYISMFAPLSGTSSLTVDFNCDDEVMLSWNKDPGATGYQLYQLGDRYLEPFLSTTDTFAIVRKSSISSNSFAVTNVYGHNTGKHEATRDFTAQGVGCYFITALPRFDIANPIAVIEVQLGTLYNISSVALEWKMGERWNVVQSLAPVVSENFILSHDTPNYDQNLYRVKLTTHDGRTILSDLIPILIAGEDSFFVYPNPADIGTELNAIIDSEEATMIELLDLTGRQIKLSQDFGAVKTFSTTGLSSGMYLLQAIKPTGKKLVRKVFLR